MTVSGRYPRYRAPQGDGDTLCVPAESELAGLVAWNQHRPDLAEHEWFGRSLADIALYARQELLAEAVNFTRQYTDVGNSFDSKQPLILAGHQPDLFHPGVWLKNFAAARLAKVCGGTAIDLIIDSDLCRSPTIRVPVGTPELLQTEIIPLDRAEHELPFEERIIVDHDLWKSFGERVSRAIGPLVPEPLIKSWWPSVLSASERTANLGQSISRARHQLEWQWGERTLELPQSHVCRTAAFRLFALQVLFRAREFRVAHNQALANYRRAHRIKNHAQPVSNLAETDGWVETPFWVWSTASPQRRGVFVRRSTDELELSDRRGLLTKLSADASIAVEQLGRLERIGVKLRTRALATTLFSRLLLADVFIHGIGGAKYDQVTDEICKTFFGVELPEHATVSGTLRLPIGTQSESPASIADLRQEFREHKFHPEKHRDKMVAPPAIQNQIDDLIAKKYGWIHTPKTHENAARRHQAIAEANRKLQEFLNIRRAVMEREMAVARIGAASVPLRASREYAYCLFPEAVLRNFLRA